MYSATCDCGQDVISRWMITMPIKMIWHDWSVHRLLFTDAWNPIKNVKRFFNTIQAKPAEKTARAKRHRR